LGDNGTVQAPKQFLVTDEVHFRTNGTDQNVKLVAYGQNAYFHRADYITANTTWATDKPHVIINASRVLVPGTDPSVFGVLVGQGFTLTIPKGARIYSHAGAYLQVNGRLLVGQDFTPTDTVKATNPNIVRFQGDRLEPFYADVPGQWGGIVFSSTSRGNMIRYAEIKNANFGVSLLNTENRTLRPDLQLENTVIRNISGSNPNYVGTGLPPGGIVGVLSDITARNCLLTNCGEYAVLGYGGSFNFNFCTFANYTPSFHRETPSLSFYNALEDANGAVQKFRVAVTLTNSIVWGSYENELLFDNYADYATNSSTLDIHNNLLRTLDYQAATNSTDKPGLGNPVLTNLVDVTDPLFKRTALISNVPDYRLQDTSPAKSRPPFGTSLTIDLLNLQRPPSGNQALGAYK
jgi:hypothetical protein